MFASRSKFFFRRSEDNQFQRCPELAPRASVRHSDEEEWRPPNQRCPELGLRGPARDSDVEEWRPPSQRCPELGPHGSARQSRKGAVGKKVKKHIGKQSFLNQNRPNLRYRRIALSNTSIFIMKMLVFGTSLIEIGEKGWGWNEVAESARVTVFCSPLPHQAFQNAPTNTPLTLRTSGLVATFLTLDVGIRKGRAQMIILTVT